MKKAAVIGLGAVSSLHLDAIAKNPNIDLAGVCDNDEKRRDKAPAGVPFFTDYQEMIRSVEPDVVHICLPHFLHLPVAIGSAEMGVNVFLEKPLALNKAEGERLVEFEASHPELRMGLSLQNRVNKTVERLKEIIDSGEYGRVTGVKGIVAWKRSKEYYEEAPWRGAFATAGGGGMINQSIHTLDLLSYLGGELHQVKAMSAQLLDYGIEVEDTVAVRLLYKNGALGLFFATNANYRNENVQIAVSMDRAEYEITDNALYRTYPDARKELLVEDEKVNGTTPLDGAGASHGKLINQFYSALERGDQDYIHLKDGLMSICVVDAIQESGKTGRAVSI